MIEKIEAKKRHFASHGWLKAFHLFSFADYYDTANMNFGTLRVFNDDAIAAHSGFDDHSHQDMEIVTIVLKGEITHKDSMGNHGVIKAGEIQRMSAGMGGIHSEKNAGDTGVELYQIWITPNTKGLDPSYDQKDFSKSMKKNALTPVVSGMPMDNALTMNTNATIFMGECESNTKLIHALDVSRGAFIYITEGTLEINGIEFSDHDQARIQDEDDINIAAKEKASFILIDVPIKSSPQP